MKLDNDEKITDNRVAMCNYILIQKFKQLEKICDRLKSECHHKDCVNVYDCPETHSNCRGRLNVYTSLIWEITIEIQRFCMIRDPRIQRVVRSHFHILKHVLCYHQDEYVEVYKILCRVSTIMLSIIIAEEALGAKNEIR